MAEPSRLLERLRQTRIVVVVRGSQTDGVCTLAGELALLGLDVHEITLTTPGALPCIERLRATHPHLVVGAGTVLDSAQARQAIDAGAQFIVSPTLDPDVISVAKENDVLAIPGSLTPTEAYRASISGADVVKVFPASLGGPSYIRALKGPLPDVELLPTGGITVDNALEYLQAGAFAVCLGTSFLRPEALEKRDFRGVMDQAKRLVHGLRNTKPITA